MKRRFWPAENRNPDGETGLTQALWAVQADEMLTMIATTSFYYTDAT